MSEANQPLFEPTFNRTVKVRSRDDRLSSRAGVLLLREADERLGLVESLIDGMVDPRNPEAIRYEISDLLRARIFALAAGHSAQDDADTLAHDPVLRLSAWGRAGEQALEERLASQPTHSRLLALLARKKPNLERLRSALAEWTERHLRSSGRDRAALRGTIDIDGFPVYTHGEQEGSAHNGYYGEQVYYPLLASFSPEGDYDSRRLGDGVIHAILRAGNAGGAAGALRFIRTAYHKARSLARTIDVRFDAAFTSGDLMDGLSEDGIRFVGRLKTNPALDRLAHPHITRPRGRPPREGYEYTVELGPYRAATGWERSQRLILVVVDSPDPKTGQLELFPRTFFLVTNWYEEEMSAQEILEHYRRRGTFEDRIGEFDAVVGAKLSSPRFEENEAILLLALLGYNLASILRGELEGNSGTGWDLGRFQKEAIHVAARVVKSGRRLLVDVASGIVPLWQALWARMERWRLPERLRPAKKPRRREWMPPPAHAHLALHLRI